MKHKLKNSNLYKFILKHYIILRLKFDIELNKNLILSFINIDYYDFSNEQRKLLTEILNYSKKNVPYYSGILKDINFDRKNSMELLVKVPLLSKSIIRSQKEKMFPNKFNSAKHANWMNTGGSTGEPLLFPVMGNLEAVHQLSLYNLMGMTKRDLIVSIDGSRIDSRSLENNIFWTYNNSNIVYGKTHFSVLYMHDDTLPYYVNHLNSIKPSIIRGYPSGLIKIANFIKDRGIILNFEIKGIYLTSEFFDKSTVSILSNIFTCPIYGQYGHAEASVFAFTQANKLEYYCSPKYGYTEVLSETGEHVGINEIGEIVVTGFYNKCMPFIRYRTGDLAIYGGNVNGFVKLNSLQGRAVDYLINSKGEKVFLVGLIFGAHLRCFENIITWQIEQNFIGEINIYIDKDVNYSESDEKEITSLLLSVYITIIYYYTNKIKLTTRGKQKFLIQNL